MTWCAATVGRTTAQVGVLFTSSVTACAGEEFLYESHALPLGRIRPWRRRSAHAWPGAGQVRLCEGCSRADQRLVLRHVQRLEGATAGDGDARSGRRVHGWQLGRGEGQART